MFCTRSLVQTPVISVLRQFSRPCLSLHRQIAPFTTVKKKNVVEFDNTEIAFKSKTNLDLLNAYFVYQCCGLPIIVNNAERILSLTRSILGDTITGKIIKGTFFRHFCAGEEHADLHAPIGVLTQQKIGSILDYAAEADLEEINFEDSDPAKKYSYKNEQICDTNRDIFLECIQAVRDVSPEGFAAIKLTALGNPLLLERMSTAIVEIRRLFTRFGGDSVLPKEKFIQGYQKYFESSQEDIEKVFDDFDYNDSGNIDIIEWTETITLKNLTDLVKSCKEKGPLWEAALTEEEINLMTKMKERIATLVENAKQLGVRLMIDAEQTYFQPSIDNFVLSMQRKYNTESPVVFNTYQCYLKDSFHRLELDIERSNREGFYFGAKMVRGAYAKSERARAEEMGYEDPIQPTIEDTHVNYHKAVDKILRQMKDDDEVKINMMIASHNEDSVQHTVNKMSEYGIDPYAGGVYFGQLLGMSDHLTCTLAHYDYKAYKYVPYGPVYEVIPYLMRRAHENGGVLGRSADEKNMVKSDLKRRMFGN